MTNLNKNGLKPSELDAGLDFVEDLFNRLLTPFFLLGDTLKSICEKDQIAGEKIEVGIKQTDLAESTWKMFKTLYPEVEIKNNKIEMNYRGVPIEIKIIKRKYKFFKNPNHLFYKIEEFLIPNPLESYWKARYLVK